MCHVGGNDVLLLFCLSSLLTLLQQCAVQCTPATAFWPFCVAYPFTHVMWLFPSNQSAVLKHNTVNFGMLYSGGYAAPHASRSMTINFYNNTKHENQTTQWLPLPNVSMKQLQAQFQHEEVQLILTQHLLLKTFFLDLSLLSGFCFNFSNSGNIIIWHILLYGIIVFL